MSIFPYTIRRHKPFVLRIAIIGAALLAAGCATMHGQQEDGQVGNYLFTYHVASPSDIQAQVFSGTNKTFISLPPGVKLQAATGNGTVYAAKRHGPYWTVDAIAPTWDFATTQGLVTANAYGAALQIINVQEAQSVVANTGSAPATPTAKPSHGATQAVIAPEQSTKPLPAIEKVKSADTNCEGLTQAGHGSPTPIPGADGHFLPLESAIHTIAPMGWSVHLGPYISPSLPVTWHKGPWTDSLQRLVSGEGMCASVDWGNRTVSIQASASLLVGTSNDAPIVPGAEQQAKTSALLETTKSEKTTRSTANSSNFHWGKAEPDAAKATMHTPAGGITLSATSILANKPVKPIAFTPTWSLAKGTLIATELKQWARQSGWTVVWQVPEDWQVPNTTTFSGDFQKAVSQVIQALSANGANVHAVFHTANNTVVISGAGGGE